MSLFFSAVNCVIVNNTLNDSMQMMPLEKQETAR